MFNIGDMISHSRIHILPSGGKVKFVEEGWVTGFCPEDENIVRVELYTKDCLMSQKVHIDSLIKINKFH